MRPARSSRRARGRCSFPGRVRAWSSSSAPPASPRSVSSARSTPTTSRLPGCGTRWRGSSPPLAPRAPARSISTAPRRRWGSCARSSGDPPTRRREGTAGMGEGRVLPQGISPGSRDGGHGTALAPPAPRPSSGAGEGEARVKVGYVLKKFPRLSETFILHEILGLEERGIDVGVASLYRPDDGRFHPALGRLRAQVTYLPEARSNEAWEWLAANRGLLGD